MHPPTCEIYEIFRHLATLQEEWEIDVNIGIAIVYAIFSSNGIMLNNKLFI